MFSLIYIIFYITTLLIMWHPFLTRFVNLRKLRSWVQNVCIYTRPDWNHWNHLLKSGNLLFNTYWTDNWFSRYCKRSLLKKEIRNINRRKKNRWQSCVIFAVPLCNLLFALGEIFNFRKNLKFIAECAARDVLKLFWCTFLSSFLCNLLCLATHIRGDILC